MVYKRDLTHQEEHSNSGSGLAKTEQAVAKSSDLGGR